MAAKGTDIWFFDYKDFNGIQMPQTIELVSAGGKMTIAERQIEINPKLEESMFKMPSK